ncbi:EF-hand calcium-binding domain-containing protein 5 isoform X1 [Chiroxiphia lanceolata]|uniref:EF-hand calcium-binding domain-containing protein 5 isoform X1 n=1 Tax=Chiroxiphia lanceolata TaxID=296741 RepID=UPI0013CEA184|nr:EF-hand calcium-binding domain-containing protein 5 isoform X1 [Chiroxiphia lanceolata]XP_032563564.1 EF-hand calcium-binding domain-containing protein 5 isoform X1 [Chiroxiphia lanceolata]XP_032563565.1 EF-hand calcium-binding domain-containing protein 5 isoform X1 [Chiroxiphia lanceolata]XP_032563566.1 EF-hand calcium-binding domain-containing protein 5 isoform X1 [Chiroxiphia lanceolata]XP_032563567.1 EF-hand calcium-binding domain-containing protein 5 isoform X1 [Chiroxiphia lanceolata]
MAAHPEESAESAGLQYPKAGHEAGAATEMGSNQGNDELPCLSNYASWRECFYEKVQERCLSLQETKASVIGAQKAEEKKTEKREPCDSLAREWYSEERETLNTRIYLLDKLLPTLIPGVENLLMEVERKHVLVSDKDPSTFDPINYLAEYLMRHNPLYSVSTKPGPYVRGMRMVVEELKSLMQGTTSERLVKMKAEAKDKREAREEMERKKAEEREMRKETLAALFKEWTVDGKHRIPMALVQSALRSFPDVTDSIPEKLRKAIQDRKLEILNTLEETLKLDEFTEFVLSYTEHVSSDTFQEVMKYLQQCGEDFQEATERAMWRQNFTDLFQDCDYGKVGVLDRQKILALLREFYDRSPVADKRELWNPRQWPIIKLQEIDLVDLWGGLGDQAAEPSDAEVSKEGEDAVSEVKGSGFEAGDLDGDATHSEEPSSQEDIKTEKEAEPESAERQDEAFPGSASDGYNLSRDGEPGSEKQVEEEESSLGREPETETKSEGDTDVADMDVTGSEQDAPAAEAVEETPAGKGSFSRQHSSQFDQQTSSETRLQDDNLLHEQDSGPSMAQIQNHRASCTQSSFGASCLTQPQFVQLMETFVGQDSSLPTVKRLIAFIKEEYKQTEEEKMEQLEKVHHMARAAQRKLLLEALFEKWDSNGHGFLDLEEVDAVLSKFMGGMKKEALMKAKAHLCSRYPQLSRVEMVSPKVFQTFLELIASELTGNEDEAIDNLVRFLTTSVEQSHRESLQSLTRRKWLQDIQQVAESGGARMELVYKAVFKAISQDAEAHGGNKKISAYIALLEESQLSAEQGQVLLRYVACTADDAPYVLNQTLHRHMKGISFAAVDEGKPIHVPRVQLHGNIHFWNSERPVEERKGSLLVLPLYDARWRVFGILGLDTLRDQCEKTIFLTHEIIFYQGVSHAFSKAYHHICTREHVLQMAVYALGWLYPRTPSIHTVTMYLVEPAKDKALCKMITSDNTGQKEIHSSPALLPREENLLRDYLFRCTDSLEAALTPVRGEQHIAVPLHDLSRQALGIFDISIGHHKKLPPQEQKDLQKMLKMVQVACLEILWRSLEETEPTYELEAEQVANVRHPGFLFQWFMLQDLRECVRKLGAESFAGVKSCAEPPALLHGIIKAVLLLLHPDWKGSEEIENWSQCKLKLDDNLIQEIYCFDPTAASVQIQAELLDCITGVPRAAVWQQGCAPAEFLYHWVHTCLALAEITGSQHSEKPHP